MGVRLTVSCVWFVIVHLAFVVVIVVGVGVCYYCLFFVVVV